MTTEWQTPPTAETRTGPAIDAEYTRRRLLLARWRATHNQRAAAERVSLDGRWAEAQTHLQQSIELDPGQAMQWIDEELEMTPNDAGLLHVRAGLHGAMGSKQAAEVDLEAVLSLVPHHGQALVDRAALLEARGDNNAADMDYQNALAQEPQSIRWLKAYGSFLDHCGREEDALEVIKRALDQAPDDAELRQQADRLEEAANRELEARRRAALAKMKLEDPDMAGDPFMLEEAAEIVAEALRISDECALAHAVQAQVLVRQNQPTQACYHIERASTLDPERDEYRQMYRSLETDLQSKRVRVRQLVEEAKTVTSPQMAHRLLQEALSLIGDDPDTLTAYAQSFWPTQLDDVRKYLTTALAAAPHHSGANALYARLLHLEGATTEARERLHTALAAQPTDAQLVTLYADLLFEEGTYKEAGEWLRTALAHTPNSVPLKGRLAVAWAHADNLEAGLRQFRETLELDPGSSWLRREYAAALRRANRYADAEVQLKTVLQIDPCDVKAYQEYAGLLSAQQRYAEAQTQIRRAVELRPEDTTLAALSTDLAVRATEFEEIETSLALAERLGNSQVADRLEEAERLFRNALRAAPAYPAAWQDYITFLEKHRHRAPAAREWFQSYQIAPISQDLEERLQALQPNGQSDTMAETDILPTVKAPEPRKPLSAWEKFLGSLRRLFGR